MPRGEWIKNMVDRAKKNDAIVKYVLGVMDDSIPINESETIGGVVADMLGQYEFTPSKEKN